MTRVYHNTNKSWSTWQFSSLSTTGYCSNADSIKQGIYYVDPSTQNIPIAIHGTLIQLNTSTTYKTQIFIQNYSDGANTWIRQYGDGWSFWKKLAFDNQAIIASSLSNPGYVKFGNGFTIQWGQVTSVTTNTPTQISFPISFSTTNFPVVGQTTSVGVTLGITYNNKNNFTYTSSASVSFLWVAIGY